MYTGVRVWRNSTTKFRDFLIEPSRAVDWFRETAWRRFGTAGRPDNGSDHRGKPGVKINTSTVRVACVLLPPLSRPRPRRSFTTSRVRGFHLEFLFLVLRLSPSRYLYRTRTFFPFHARSFVFDSTEEEEERVNARRHRSSKEHSFGGPASGTCKPLES